MGFLYFIVCFALLILLTKQNKTKQKQNKNKKIMTSPIDLNSVDPQVLADYKEVFSTFDRDGDGTIDATELGAVMASFGVNPSQAELAKMIEDVDLDKSGAIDFQEFVTMMQSRSNTSNPEDEAESVFYVLDKDKDG